MSTIRRLIWPRQLWRRIAVGLTLVVFAAAALCWHHTRPAQLTPRVENALSNLTHAHVTIGHAQLTWGPRLILDQVAFSIPGDNTAAGRLLEADQVIIGLDPGGAVTGDLTPKSFGIRRPILFLTEDTDTGVYNIQRLTLDTGASDAPPPSLLPRSFIDGGEVRIGRVRDGKYDVLGSIQVVGRLDEVPESQGVYAFELIGRQPNADQHVTIAGSADLNDLTVRLEVEGLSMGSVHQRFIPSAYRSWHEAIRPEGRFPKLTLELAPNDQGTLIPQQVELQVEDLALSLPAELLQLGEDEHEIRMTHVSGVSRLTGGIIYDRFTGSIEGVNYTFVGSHGITPDAPFDLTLATEPFELPRDPKFFFALPAVAKKYYTRFSPSGRFKTNVRLIRETPGGEIRTTGTVDIIDAQARYKKFPYPGKSITGGTITFTQEELTIKNLRAQGPSGAVILVNGLIAPPIDDAAVDVHVELIDIPIDEHLTGAMQPKHRRMLEMFFDPQSFQSLVQRGVLRSDAPARQDLDPDEKTQEGEAPYFTPGGIITHAKIRILRAFGKDMEYLVTTTIDVEGLRVLYKHWPYPLIAREGTLVIADQVVKADAIGFVGLTGARAVIDGQIDRPEDGPIAPDLQIQDARLPMDRLLLASIPQPQDQWVDYAGVEGELNATGKVFRHPGHDDDADEDAIDFVVQATLKDATATPFGGRFKVDQLQGAFELTRHGLSLRNVTSRRGDATLSLSGQIDWSDEEPMFAVEVGASQLAVNDELLDLIPPDHPGRSEAEPVFKSLKPIGTTNAHVEWKHRAGEDSFDLTLEPKALTFTHHDTRMTLTDIDGAVRVFPKHVELDVLDVRFPEGQARLTGVLSLDGTRTTLGIEARADRLCDTIRAVLPDQAVQVIDTLALDGAYDLKSARYSRKPGESGLPTTDFAGILELSGASGEPGIKIEALEGRLGITVIQKDDQALPFVDLALDADRLLAEGRQVAPMRLKMRTNARHDAIAIREMRGSIYGGTLVGKGMIAPGEDGFYAFDIALHAVALEPFINPGIGWEPDQSEGLGENALLNQPLRRQADTGLLSASLGIQASFDRPGDWQGRGALEIRDARLFKRPLSLALLQAANLSLPRSSAFDRVSSRFVLLGDTIQFDTLSFDSPTVSITGSGTMSYTTKRLDLTMHNRNPLAWDLGPVNELFNTLKDELIAIRVGGTLEEPDARVESFESVRRTWDDIFGGSKATPIGAGEYVND